MTKEEIEKAKAEGKYKARRFICNSQVMNRPQDVDAYASLMYNLTKCIGWVRTPYSEERMRVAIDSLAEYILGKFDEAYEPTKYKVDATIGKTFTVEADDAVDAVRRVAEAVRANGGELADACAEEADDE